MASGTRVGSKAFGTPPASALHPQGGVGFGQHPRPLHYAPPDRDPRTPVSILGAARERRRQREATGGERRAPRPGEGRWQWRTAPGRRSCAGGGSTGAAPTSLRIPQPRRGCRRPPGPERRDAGGCRPRSATPRPGTTQRNQPGKWSEYRSRSPRDPRTGPRGSPCCAPQCRGGGGPRVPRFWTSPVGLRGPVDGGSRSRSHRFASPLGAGVPHPTRAARIPPCCGSGPSITARPRTAGLEPAPRGCGTPDGDCSDPHRAHRAPPAPPTPLGSCPTAGRRSDHPWCVDGGPERVGELRGSSVCRQRCGRRWGGEGGRRGDGVGRAFIFLF